MKCLLHCCLVWFCVQFWMSKNFCWEKWLRRRWWWWWRRRRGSEGEKGKLSELVVVVGGEWGVVRGEKWWEVWRMVNIICMCLSVFPWVLCSVAFDTDVYIQLFMCLISNWKKKTFIFNLHLFAFLYFPPPLPSIFPSLIPPPPRPPFIPVKGKIKKFYFMSSRLIDIEKNFFCLHFN